MSKGTLITFALGTALSLPASAFAAGLTTSQIQAVEALLQSFGVDASTVATVDTVLNGGTPTTTIPSFGVGMMGSSTLPCPQLPRMLMPGSSGSDVSNLQGFLSSAGVYNGPTTGYFGSMTEGAVQKFQEENDVVSNGSPSTTGFGAVGPSTRMAFMNRCGEHRWPPPPGMGSTTMVMPPMQSSTTSSVYGMPR